MTVSAYLRPRRGEAPGRRLRLAGPPAPPLMQGGVTPVLELGRLLQELQAGVGQEDARHHGLQVVLLHVLGALLAQDVEQPRHAVRLRHVWLDASAAGRMRGTSVVCATSQDLFARCPTCRARLRSSQASRTCRGTEPAPGSTSLLKSG